MKEEAKKEEKVTEQKKRQGIFNKKFLLLVVVSIIVAIILSRKEFIRYSGKIPYGWDSSVNRSLHDHAKTQPTRNVMILTGAYQSGKSTALNTLADEMTVYGGALVINADFSTVHSEQDFVGIMKIALYKGLSLLRQPISYEAKHLAEFFPQTEDSDENGLLPIYGRIFSSLSKDLDTLEDGTIGLPRFFDKLEKINYVIKVSCFFHSIDNIFLFAPKHFENLFNAIGTRSAYTEYVPIFCELKDSSLRLMFNLKDLSYQVIEINRITNPKSDFVSKNKVFTEGELKAILATFGEHGGSIERIYEDIKVGVSLNKSIELTKRRIQDAVIQAMSDIPNEKRVQLCGNTTTLAVDDVKSYKSLLVKGFVYIKDDFEFQFANRIVNQTICNQTL